MLKNKMTFSPDEVGVLVRAYADAARALGLTAHPPSNGLSTPQYKVAHRIMTLALQGERDFERLREAGVQPTSFSPWAA